MGRASRRLHEQEMVATRSTPQPNTRPGDAWPHNVAVHQGSGTHLLPCWASSSSYSTRERR